MRSDKEEGDSSMIFFPGDQEDFENSASPEFRSHMLAAFAHKAGLGPDPGKYNGPGVRMGEGGADRDVPTEADRQRATEELD
jgi:hypothetical protein